MNTSRFNDHWPKKQIAEGNNQCWSNRRIGRRFRQVKDPIDIFGAENGRNVHHSRTSLNRGQHEMFIRLWTLFVNELQKEKSRANSFSCRWILQFDAPCRSIFPRCKRENSVAAILVPDGWNPSCAVCSRELLPGSSTDHRRRPGQTRLWRSKVSPKNFHPHLHPHGCCCWWIESSLWRLFDSANVFDTPIAELDAWTARWSTLADERTSFATILPSVSIASRRIPLAIGSVRLRSEGISSAGVRAIADWKTSERRWWTSVSCSWSTRVGRLHGKRRAISSSSIERTRWRNPRIDVSRADERGFPFGIESNSDRASRFDVGDFEESREIVRPDVVCDRKERRRRSIGGMRIVAVGSVWRNRRRDASSIDRWWVSDSNRAAGRWTKWCSRQSRQIHWEVVRECVRRSRLSSSRSDRAVSRWFVSRRSWNCGQTKLVARAILPPLVFALVVHFQTDPFEGIDHRTGDSLVVRPDQWEHVLFQFLVDRRVTLEGRPLTIKREGENIVVSDGGGLKFTKTRNSMLSSTSLVTFELRR